MIARWNVLERQPIEVIRGESNMINKASTMYITWKGYEFCLLSDEILFKPADNPPAM